MQNQNRIMSEPIADSSTLSYVNSISHDEDIDDQFNSIDEYSNQVNGSCTDDSCTKSYGITETSPEPEPEISNFNSDAKGSDDSYFEKKIAAHRRIKRILLTIVLATSLLFIGCFIGLIVIATYKKPSQGLNSKSNDTAGSSFVSKISDPLLPYEFDHFDGTDSTIALAFADHSLYYSFFGITYEGPGLPASGDSKIDSVKQKRATSNASNVIGKNPEVQRQVTQDIALLSRVTSRIRLVNHAEMLTDRVMQAVRDLNINVKLVLGINTDNWHQESHNIRRILNSYPTESVETIFVEESQESPDATYKAYKELHEFLQRHEMSQDIQLKINVPQTLQANPLKLALNPKPTIEWVNTDFAYSAYTNLETPSETSEKASYMTSWVCGIVPSLRSNVQWYWSNAFDNKATGIQNGIFTEDRKMKPAGLPRCKGF